MKLIRLYVSMRMSEWKKHFFTKGIKAGEVEGCANGKKAILVQSFPFHLCNGKFLVVEFEKSLSKTYVDYDYDPELPVDYNTPKYGRKTYATVDVSKVPKNGVKWFGSYVKEIRPKEIIKVEVVTGKTTEKEGVSVWINGKDIFKRRVTWKMK